MSRTYATGGLFIEGEMNLLASLRTCAFLFAHFAHKTAGAASTRSSLRPLTKRVEINQQTSGEIRRENAKLYPPSLRAKRSNPRAGTRKEWIASLRSQ